MIDREDRAARTPKHAKPVGLAGFAARRATANPTQRRDKSIAAKIARAVVSAAEKVPVFVKTDQHGIPRASATSAAEATRQVKDAYVGPIKDFIDKPGWTTGAFAAMALPIPGKVVPLGAGRAMIRTAMRGTKKAEGAALDTWQGQRIVMNDTRDEAIQAFDQPLTRERGTRVGFTGRVQSIQMGSEQRFTDEFDRTRSQVERYMGPTQRDRIRAIEEPHQRHRAVQRILKQHRKDEGITVNYNIVDAHAADDPDYGKIIGSISYRIARDRVIVDEAWMRPDVRESTVFMKAIQKAVLPATENGKRYVTAVPANPGVALLLHKMAKREARTGVRIDPDFHDLDGMSLDEMKKAHRDYVQSQRTHEMIRQRMIQRRKQAAAGEGPELLSEDVPQHPPPSSAPVRAGELSGSERQLRTMRRVRNTGIRNLLTRVGWGGPMNNADRDRLIQLIRETNEGRIPNPRDILSQIGMNNPRAEEYLNELVRSARLPRPRH